MELITAAIEYVDHAGRMRTPSSVRAFMREAQTLHDTIGAGANLADVTPELLTEWCMRNHPAPNTVKKRRGLIRGFFGWCAYKGYVDIDPSAGLGYSVQPGRGPVKTHTWLTKVDAVRLMRSLPDTARGDRDRLIVMLGALCGLRANEMCNLRWEHLAADFTSFECVGKGNKLATLGVPRELRTALVDWSGRRDPGALAVLPTMRYRWDPDVHANVVHIDWSRPLEYAGVYDAIRRAGDACGMRLRPHDLRRTFAGILESDGVPVTDIQRAMRHSSVGTTSKYLESNPRRAVEATAGLELGL